MEFETQRALLRYLGKCEDDRKLVKRMINRGEVYKSDGMYYLVEGFKKKKPKDLYDEIRELKGKVALLEDNVYTFNENELDEAKAQWAYYKELYQKEKSDKQNRIRKAFRWIQSIRPSANWEEFRDWVMGDEE